VSLREQILAPDSTKQGHIPGPPWASTLASVRGGGNATGPGPQEVAVLEARQPMSPARVCTAPPQLRSASRSRSGAHSLFNLI
jgi:hypothetical protein